MYQIVFDEKVLQKDLLKIDKKSQEHILKAIEKKLSLAPFDYGSPLRKELFGYWKLRVGDYRVIYRIEKSRLVVVVVKIGFRRDKEVYHEAKTRIG